MLIIDPQATSRPDGESPALHSQKRSLKYWGRGGGAWRSTQFLVSAVMSAVRREKRPHFRGEVHCFVLCFCRVDGCAAHSCLALRSLSNLCRIGYSFRAYYLAADTRPIRASRSETEQANLDCKSRRQSAEQLVESAWQVSSSISGPFENVPPKQISVIFSASAANLERRLPGHTRSSLSPSVPCGLTATAPASVPASVPTSVRMRCPSLHRASKLVHPAPQALPTSDRVPVCQPSCRRAVPLIVRVPVVAAAVRLVRVGAAVPVCVRALPELVVRLQLLLRVLVAVVILGCKHTSQRSDAFTRALIGCV